MRKRYWQTVFRPASFNRCHNMGPIVIGCITIVFRTDLVGNEFKRIARHQTTDNIEGRFVISVLLSVPIIRLTSKGEFFEFFSTTHPVNGTTRQIP